MPALTPQSTASGVANARVLFFLVQFRAQGICGLQRTRFGHQVQAKSW